MDSVDPTPHLERFDSYEQACRDFRWLIPRQFNIATNICRRHADAVTRIALSDVKEGGVNAYTFGGLDFLSDKFATALSESGISEGDSVAVALAPSAALAIAHLGVLKTGAAIVPLSPGSDAALVRHALADSAAKALVVDESIYGAFEALAPEPPNLVARFVVRDLRPDATSAEFKDFWSEVDRASSDFDVVEPDSNSAALIFYVESKNEITGVVHSHRSMLGQFAAFEMFNDVEDESEAVFWTAGDWSSPAAALGVLYPAWWYGCSVVAGASEDRAHRLRFMEQCEVTNVFMPSAGPGSAGPGSAGVPACCFRFEASEQAGTPALPGPNQVYGGPETGWIFGSCARWFATPRGSVGRPVPGHSIEIIDQNGNVLPPGLAGHIAVHKSDPALFIEFRGDAARTAASFIGDWFLTGDVGYKNGDGDLYIAPSPSVVGTD